MEMTIDQLIDKANLIREEIIKMLVNAGSGHAAGPLGAADFFTGLYFSGRFNYRVDDPWWEERDRLVMSAGHVVPVLYATLAEAGFFPKSELMSLRKINSRLQGHPHVRSLPGIENSAGPLGQGISQAVGMALSAKMDHKNWRVICFMSDGEQDEGQVWEAYMSAVKYELSNLLIVIDRNKIQIDGFTSEVMPLEPLAGKLAAFGLNVIEIDGNDMSEVIRGLDLARAEVGKPSVIVLKTVPGKGVSFMENKPEWHGTVPAGVGEAVKAIEDIHRLRTLNGQIISEDD